MLHTAHARPLPLYISVDVEVAGPNPSDYSLLSIGACLVHQPQVGVYIELQPVSDRYTEEAQQVSGLSLERLRDSGLPPEGAMASLEEWVLAVLPAGSTPVFAGFNAPFDWMFVCDYFHRYLGRNPFGHAALDIKALYMGVTGAEWLDTSFRALAERYRLEPKLTHNALADAQDQAVLMQHVLAERRPGR